MLNAQQLCGDVGLIQWRKPDLVDGILLELTGHEPYPVFEVIEHRWLILKPGQY